MGALCRFARLRRVFLGAVRRRQGGEGPADGPSSRLACTGGVVRRLARTLRCADMGREKLTLVRSLRICARAHLRTLCAEFASFRGATLRRLRQSLVILRLKVEWAEDFGGFGFVEGDAGRLFPALG